MIWSDIPWRPPARTLRQFAALWLVCVGFLACRLGLYEGAALAGVALGALAAVVGVSGLLWPTSVRPLFVGLTIATLPLGWLLSRLVLAVVFYALFAPLALLFRLRRRDALEIRPCPNRSTYWHPKRRVDDPRRYLRPY